MPVKQRIRSLPYTSAGSSRKEKKHVSPRAGRRFATSSQW